MTGFESWLKAGVELSVEWLLGLGADLDLNSSEALPVLAQRVWDRWPPWKVVVTKARELPLDYHRCSICDRPADRVMGTSYGPVCLSCLGHYIHGEHTPAWDLAFERKARGE